MRVFDCVQRFLAYNYFFLGELFAFFPTDSNPALNLSKNNFFAFINTFNTLKLNADEKGKKKKIRFFMIVSILSKKVQIVVLKRVNVYYFLTQSQLE